MITLAEGVIYHVCILEFVYHSVGCCSIVCGEYNTPSRTKVLHGDKAITAIGKRGEEDWRGTVSYSLISWTAAVRSSKKSDASSSVGTLMQKSGPRRGESGGVVRFHASVRSGIQLVPLG